MDFQATTASGALIIEESSSSSAPFPVDGDRVVLLQELFNITDATARQRLESIPFAWTGENDGWLINGKGISNYSVVNTSAASWDVIDVAPSSTYRLRFIGGNTLTHAIVGIDQHPDLRIIEADGSYTQPYNTSFLQIGSGQRFSTLLTTKSCAELAAMNGTTDFYLMVQSRQRPAQSTSYAIVRYDVSRCRGPSKSRPQATRVSTTAFPAQQPFMLPPTSYSWLEYALTPLNAKDIDDFPSASEVTRTVVISAQQVINPNGGIQWNDSQVTWTEDASDPNPHMTPMTPYLVSLYENQAPYTPNLAAAIANGGLDPVTKTFPAAIGEVIEFVIQQLGNTEPASAGPGGALDTHPWHAHGAHYYDIGTGPGAYNPTANEQRLAGYHPVKRDTTMLYPFAAHTTENTIAGWRAWRFRVTDPGVWMVHCHILQHMLMGMQTVWVHGNTSEILQLPATDVQGYLTYGGNVCGNATHSPNVIHFSEVGRK